MNLSNVTTFFTNLEIPFPGLSAFIVAMFELVGGISLFLGFRARLMSLFLIVIMITAFFTAHADNITTFSFITNPAKVSEEAPFSFLYTSLVIFIFGAGKFSIDYALKNKQP